jgi:hypothetical protein
LPEQQTTNEENGNNFNTRETTRHPPANPRRAVRAPKTRTRPTPFPRKVTARRKSRPLRPNRRKNPPRKSSARNFIRPLSKNLSRGKTTGLKTERLRVRIRNGAPSLVRSKNQFKNLPVQSGRGPGQGPGHPKSGAGAFRPGANAIKLTFPSRALPQVS